MPHPTIHHSGCGRRPYDGTERCFLPAGHRGWHRGRAIGGFHAWPPEDDHTEPRSTP